MINMMTRPRSWQRSKWPVTVMGCDGHHFDGGVGDNYRFCFKKVFSFFRMNDGELPRDWTL